MIVVLRSLRGEQYVNPTFQGALAHLDLPVGNTTLRFLEIFKSDKFEDVRRVKPLRAVLSGA